MKRWIFNCAALLTVFELAIHAAADDPPTAGLKITFVYDSDSLPNPIPIDTSKDSWCRAGKSPLYQENLIVDSKTYGIKNVILYPWRGGNLTRDDVDEDDLKKATEPVVLESENCVFKPHVISAIVGGSVVTKNLDETGHMTDFSFFVAGFGGALIPAGGVKKIDIKKAELAPIPIDCYVHPWMRAYVIATDTPFVGISNEKGELIIKKLPTSRLLKLKLWHESSKGAIEKVDLDGKIVHWKKGVIELNLQPGMNDLGVCKLTPEHFKD